MEVAVGQGEHGHSLLPRVNVGPARGAVLGLVENGVGAPWAQGECSSRARAHLGFLREYQSRGCSAL